MKIIPYQYAPYLNINNNPKNERNVSFLVTTTTENKRVNKITVNTKSEVSPTVGSFQSPISFISDESTINFLKEIKPDALKNIYNNENGNKKEPTMTDLLPPKPIPNSNSKSNSGVLLTPKSSKLDNLSFVSDEIFKSNSFKLEDNRQSSLDIVNFDFQPNESEMNKRITLSEEERQKEETVVEKEIKSETNKDDKEKEKEQEQEKEKEKEKEQEQEKEKEKEKEKEMEMEMEMEKKNVKMNLGRPVIELKLPNSTNNIPSKSPIEGFKTDIVLSPFSAISPRPLMIGNNSAIRNDFQSNMNGTIFQNQRFSAYLESINQIGQSNITSPMAQPLHTNYKSTISEYRSQLHHHSDMNRVTFPSIVEAYEEESQRDRKLNQVTEEELKAWLSTATPEEIFNNMHRIIGVPKKMFLKNSKSMEVFKKSPDYPVLGMDQYMYKEPKVFTPLYVKYKNMNVTIYIKNSDFHCTAGKEKISKLNIFPFPLHIAVGVSYNENVLNVHIVVQNTKRDYCIKTVSFITASETIALTYSDILFQNIYYDEDSILRTSFVQIYIDSNNEELRNFINRWFRVPFELANCNYEIITDISQISIAAQVFIFMTRKEDVCKNIEKINKWEESMAIVHQTIYGHPLQVIMAALKERFYERWLLEYNDWKKYK